MSDPFAEPLAEHQTQITEAQHIAEQRLRVGVKLPCVAGG